MVFANTFLIFVFAFVVFPHVNDIRIDGSILLISFLVSLIAHKFPALLFVNNVASSLYWFCLGFEANKYRDDLEKIDGIINYGMAFLSGFMVILIVRGGGKQSCSQGIARNCCDIFYTCNL